MFAAFASILEVRTVELKIAIALKIYISFLSVSHYLPQFHLIYLFI